MEIEEDVKQYPWRRNKIEETKITFEENENEDDRYWNPKSQKKKNFGNKTSQRKKIFPPQIVKWGGFLQTIKEKNED